MRGTGRDLKKLIPRLASEHDGEVVATVRAIQRTLHRHGYDLNDLANHLDEPAKSSGQGGVSASRKGWHGATSGPAPPGREEPDWDRLTRTYVLRWCDLVLDRRRLDMATQQFLCRVRGRLASDPDSTLSPDDVSKLRAVLRAAWQGGLAP